jgi:hypothetical protein
VEGVDLMGWAAPVASAAISAGGSILGGIMGNQGNQETKLQRQRRKLIDELLGSLKSGSGAFSDLFNVDEEMFNKAYVEPAMSRFSNRIAPGIQQEFIASGMQRGTGLDDTLTRAGVDLQNDLNRLYGDFYQQGINRRSNLLSGILGSSDPGAPNPMSTGQAAGQAAAGYFASPGFGKAAEGIGNWFASNQNDNMTGRVGYEQNRNTWQGGY